MATGEQQVKGAKSEAAAATRQFWAVVNTVKNGKDLETVKGLVQKKAGEVKTVSSANAAAAPARRTKNLGINDALGTEGAPIIKNRKGTGQKRRKGKFA